MDSILLVSLAWLVVSFLITPAVGFALRRADLLEKARSVEALQARAQHPASRAA